MKNPCLMEKVYINVDPEIEKIEELLGRIVVYDANRDVGKPRYVTGIVTNAKPENLLPGWIIVDGNGDSGILLHESQIVLPLIDTPYSGNRFYRSCIKRFS